MADAAQIRPTFLGVGAPRCGTTWLHEILAAHPGVFVPADKELHYWSDRVRDRDLDWYFGHFAGAAGHGVRGEITPAYASLPRRVVEAVARTLPALRIVLLIRNPVDRIWSHTVRYYYQGRTEPGDVLPLHRYIRRFERFSTRRMTDYERTMDNWGAVYGREALFVGLYDDLSRDAAGLVRGVLAHLGADERWQAPAEALAATVNAQPREAVEMPPYCRWYLSDRWLEPTTRLNERLGGRVSGWVADLEAWRAERPQGSARRILDRATIALPELAAGGARYGLRSRAIVQRCERLSAPTTRVRR